MALDAEPKWIYIQVMENETLQRLQQITEAFELHQILNSAIGENKPLRLTLGT
jgi:hypothetical protein